ncbi:MAG: glycosyltransferase family 4 protein [Chloroflexi bacterium]|nr:glycosyltransferase family 4 protein [Chloroflexota bacterium]MBP7042871.1 glycosyltransferase family 4 protein [Chloroflexota bacterium]
MRNRDGRGARILYLDHAPIWGGAEAVLVNLLPHLDRRQFLPLVATAPASPLAQRLAHSETPVLPVPLDTLNRAGWRLPLHLAQSVTAVTRLIRQQHIALIHTNTVRAHVVGSLAGWLTRTPVVWTLHDNTFPPGLVRLLAPIPRRVIAVSGWLAAVYTPAGLAGKLTIIPNGLNQINPPADATAVRAELRIPPDAPLVLNVGRLVAGKAPHLFIQAAEMVAARHAKVHFVLVGGADNAEPTTQAAAYDQLLAQTVAQSTLGSRLLLTGPRPDALRFFATADVCVYNAVLPEGLPTVLLEAMALAKPTVASAIGGALEIVVDGVTGLLAAPGSPGELADKLCALLANSAQMRQMGEAGLARVRETFNLEKQAAATAVLYQQLLATSPQAAPQ